MKLYLRIVIIWIILCHLLNHAHAATYYSIQNGPWTHSSTWSLTSGGPAIPSGYPVETEKSTDGQNFYRAGIVAAKGNSYSTMEYTWDDENITATNNYYRIKSIGIDGEIIYSRVVNIISGKLQPQISLYPNPVKENSINLQFVKREKGNYTVWVSNAAGQSIFRKTILHAGGSATYCIHLDNLFAAGIYHLKISNNKFLQTQTILKK